MDQAARGAAALSASDYEKAVDEYTAALAVSPTSPDYYIQRSSAYHRLSKYSEALHDAERGVVCATNRAKLELIAKAQLRRAIALFHLERYGDAKFVLDVVKRLTPQEKTIAVWEMKVARKLGEVGEGNEKAKVGIKEVPDAQLSEKLPGNKGTAAAQALPPQPTPADKVRHDWYQNNDYVYFTLLAKGVPKDKLSVTMHNQFFSLSYPINADSTYDLTLDPLYAPIDVAKSSFNVTPSKVECTLKKMSPGKWKSLEGDEVRTDSGAIECSDGTTLSAPQVKSEIAPSYPTSSRSGPKDWDKVARELSKKPKEDGKGGEDEVDDDMDEGDDVNKFFKTLYAGASDDTKRAMMKSFQESNGTVLSTDWNDVGKKKVEVQPPDGQEAREWDK